MGIGDWGLGMELKGNVDKYNSSSDYFNSKCYTSTSEDGTDSSLADRKKEFINGNDIVCQNGCFLAYYNSSINYGKCSCGAKEASSNFKDMNINRNEIFEDSITQSSTNFDITACNVLSSPENIKSNTGFYLLLIILAIFIIVFIAFCSRGYNLLMNKMDEVIYKKFDKSKTKNHKITNNNSKSKKSKGKTKNKIVINSQIYVDKMINNNKSKKKSSKRKSSKFKKHIPIKIKNSLLNKKKSVSSSCGKILGKYHHNTINFNGMNENEISINSKPDTDYELNWLSYAEAIRFDKRENCDYYGALIKSKQIFIFTFCSFNDYNSGIIKKFILFLSFALHYTANAFFFNDDNMHQIFEDKGKFNFKYQISFILYSAIISNFVLRIMLQTLVLTDKDILAVKLQATKPMAINMKNQKLKYIKIKYAIFFILNFILLGLFWYYLTCFNAIYKNTQIYLIENTAISFAFSLFYPFVINIFPTIFRGYAIHSESKNHQCIYRFSQIIQLL